MKTILSSLLVAVGVAAAAVAAIPYERPITPPVYGPAPGIRSVAATASSGRESLVVWNDTGRGAIYAARISDVPSVLDETGIRIEGSVPYTPFGPWVFWNGTTYVLFWTKTSELQSARVDGDGKIVEPPHAVLASTPVFGMAASGARIVASYGNRLAVFDMTGVLLEKDISLPSAVGEPFVSLVSNGGGFLASFPSLGGDYYAISLDAFGHPAGPLQLIAQGVLYQVPVQASNGNEYFLVLNDALGNPPAAFRIASSGVLIDRHTLPAPRTVNALAWTGSEYVCTWSDSTSISALRLDPSGGATRGGPVVLANVVASSPRITTAGQRLLLTFYGASSTINAELVTPITLAHTPPLLVSVSAAEQLAPKAAFNGSHYLVLWQEAKTLYAARLDAEGRTLQPGAIELAIGARNANVVFDGENFVVAWQQTTNNTLWLMRIDDNGTLLDGDGVAALYFACSYDIASSRFATMIAFGDCGGHLEAMRFDRLLHPLDVPLRITPTSMTATNPSIAWGGTQWLVAFEEVIPLPVFFDPVPPDLGSRGNIRAVRISPSMTPLDTQPIVVATSDDDKISLRAPHAASSGSDYLVTWTRGFFTTGPREVHAQRLGRNLPTYVAAGVATSAIWTGTDYAAGFISPNSDALGVTLGDDTRAFFKIAVTTDAEPSLALVAANGRLSGAYTRVAMELLYGGVSRVFIRDARPLHGRAARH